MNARGSDPPPTAVSDLGQAFTNVFPVYLVWYCLLTVTVLGTIAFSYNLYFSIQNQAWVWAIIFTVAYSCVLIVTLLPQISYPLRAGTLLVLLVFLGLVSVFLNGYLVRILLWNLEISGRTAVSAPV